MTRRAALLQKLVHFLTAFTLLMKALAKLDHPEGYWPVITLLLLSVLYIVIVTLLHDRLHRHLKLIDASVYVIECVIMGVVARLSFHEGAQYFPWLYVFSSIGFAVAVVLRLARPDRSHITTQPATQQPAETKEAATPTSDRPDIEAN